MTDHRRTFIDKNLIYLFSYDVNLEGEENREEIGPVVDGTRMNIFVTEQESRVYNVRGERAFQGNRMPAGTICWGVDYALLKEDDVARLDVHLKIRTDDHEVILMSYQGLFTVGPRGYRRIVSEKPKLGSEQQPFESKLFVGPRFKTAAPQYAWLQEYHCAAFGRSWVIDTKIRRASYDVYAMD
jgi:hypothetical protein